MRYLEELNFIKNVSVASDSDIVLGIEYIDEDNNQIDLENCVVRFSIIDEDRRFLYRDVEFKRKGKDFIVPAQITKSLFGKYNLKISIEKRDEKTSFNILLEVR